MLSIEYQQYQQPANRKEDGKFVRIRVRFPLLLRYKSGVGEWVGRKKSVVNCTNEIMPYKPSLKCTRVLCGLRTSCDSDMWCRGTERVANCDDLLHIWGTLHTEHDWQTRNINIIYSQMASRMRRRMEKEFFKRINKTPPKTKALQNLSVVHSSSREKSLRR